MAHTLLVGGSTKSISVYPHGMVKNSQPILAHRSLRKLICLFTKGEVVAEDNI